MIIHEFQRFVFDYQGQSFIQAATQTSATSTGPEEAATQASATSTGPEDLDIDKNTHTITQADPLTTGFKYKGRVVTEVKSVLGNAVWTPGDGQEFSKWRKSHQGSIEVAVLGSTKIVVLAFLVYWQYIDRQILLKNVWWLHLVISTRSESPRF